VSLAELIAERPKGVLGEAVIARFGNTLPFLLKVLAAARPLSIQAHPDREQAREGYERETALNVPIDAKHRNYKDANHKPEVICAITLFWALKGFRPVGEIIAAFQGVSAIEPELAALKDSPNKVGLKAYFDKVMTLDLSRRRELVDQVVSRARPGAEKNTHDYWLVKLDQLHPGDLGVACALMLNLVPLRPGQALYVPAGELHAYLEGTGIELMANSDNVLRGGLTEKHVDTQELLRTLTFNTGSAEVLTGEGRGPAETVFRTDAEEFELSVIRLDGSRPYVSNESPGVEILLATEGNATITDCGAERDLGINRGCSVLVPAAVPQYRINGGPNDTTTLFKAAVPL